MESVDVLVRRAQAAGADVGAQQEAFAALVRRFQSLACGYAYALLGFLGLQSAVIADGLSFLLSGLLLAQISGQPTAEPTAGGHGLPGAGESWRTIWRDWWDGLGVVRNDGMLAVLFLTMSVFWLSQGLFGVLIVPFAQRTLGTPLERCAPADMVVEQARPRHSQIALYTNVEMVARAGIAGVLNSCGARTLSPRRGSLPIRRSN